jgi:hypothetical protein
MSVHRDKAGRRRANRYTFGSRSNMDANETFKTLHISNRRDALTRLTPFSYF